MRRSSTCGRRPSARRQPSTASSSRRTSRNTISPPSKNARSRASPLNPEVFNRWKEATGLELTEGFGQSETTVIIANFPWFPIKPGSTGKFSPLYDLDIVDEDGNSCEDGIVGTIVVKNLDRFRPAGLLVEYRDDPRRQ